jgi:PhnB protein
MSDTRALRLVNSETLGDGIAFLTKRLSPHSIDGATSRTLLVVEDPDSVMRQAVAARATESSPVQNEHGWRLGRIVDPFGHQWEIGIPLEAWPVN